MQMQYVRRTYRRGSVDDDDDDYKEETDANDSSSDGSVDWDSLHPMEVDGTSTQLGESRTVVPPTQAPRAHRKRGNFNGPSVIELGSSDDDYEARTIERFLNGVESGVHDSPKVEASASYPSTDALGAKSLGLRDSPDSQGGRGAQSLVHSTVPSPMPKVPIQPSSSVSMVAAVLEVTTPLPLTLPVVVSNPPLASTLLTVYAPLQRPCGHQSIRA